MSIEGLAELELGLKRQPPDWSYQDVMIEDLKSSIMKGHRRIVMYLPTGGGKSVLFRRIGKGTVDKGNRFAGVAHRDPLIRQLKKHMLKAGIAEENISIIKAEEASDYTKPVQICSLQTLIDRQIPHAHVWIWDEGHHCVAPSFRSVIEATDAIHIALTATPATGNGRGLGQNGLFTDMVKGPSVNELIHKYRCLAEYEFYSGGVQPDLSDVKVTAMGDFNLEHLAEHLEDTELIGDLVDTWKRLMSHRDNRRTFTFAVDRTHARMIASEYQEAGVSADWVDATLSFPERQARIRKFITGELDILVSVGIFCEGFDLATYSELFDLPEVDIVCAQIARPTKSLGLYLQMVGRALRNLSGETKLILDHARCLEYHGLPCDPHKWTLEGVVPRTRIQAADEEREEQQRQERESRMQPVQDRNGQLVKVDPQDKVGRYAIATSSGQPGAWQKFLDMKPSFEEVFKANELLVGKSNSWAYKEWLKTGVEINLEDLEELKTIAKLCGFNWQWAKHERVRLVTEREKAKTPVQLPGIPVAPPSVTPQIIQRSGPLRVSPPKAHS